MFIDVIYNTFRIVFGLVAELGADVFLGDSSSKLDFMRGKWNQVQDFSLFQGFL